MPGNFSLKRDRWWLDLPFLGRRKPLRTGKLLFLTARGGILRPSKSKLRDREAAVRERLACVSKLAPLRVSGAIRRPFSARSSPTSGSDALAEYRPGRRSPCVSDDGLLSARCVCSCWADPT